MLLRWSRLILIARRDFYKLPRSEDVYCTDWPTWVRKTELDFDALKKSYRVAHGLLGSKAQTCYGNIFQLRTLFVRRFDVTLAGAILEHLNDPVSALANMAMVTKERLIVAFTPFIESDEIILRAAHPMTDPDADFTWWIGSRGLYRKVLENMGFQIESIVPSVAFKEPKGEPETRSTLVARGATPKPLPMRCGARLRLPLRGVLRMHRAARSKAVLC